MRYKRRFIFIIYFLFQFAFFAVTILSGFVYQGYLYTVALFFMGLFFFLIYHFFLSVQNSLVQGAKVEAEVELLKQQQAIKTRQDEELLNRKQETIRFQKDMQEKLIILHNLLSEGQVTEAKKYLQNISSEFEEMRFRPCCSDSLINAILDSKRQAALARDIEVSYELLFPEDSFIASSDLSCIFFNLMDNAIEACAASGAAHPLIRLSTGWRSGFLTIHMENSKNPHDHFTYGTSKADALSHGLGLSIIEETVKKYDGICQWKTRGTTLTPWPFYAMI